MVYVYLASFVGFFASVISMAEISSMYVFGYAISSIGSWTGSNDFILSAPTSGGQYHWVSEFAAPRWQRFLSYLTGRKTASQFLSHMVLISSRVAVRSGMASSLRQHLLPLWNPDSGSSRVQLLRH